MTDMITRCPSCDTSFRITQAQLQTAKGAVRCGACLHIFKAVDHLVADENKPNKTAGTLSGSTAEKQPTPTKTSSPIPTKKTYKESPKFEYHKPNVPSPMIALLDDQPAASDDTHATTQTKSSKVSESNKHIPTDNTDVIDFGDDSDNSADAKPSNNQSPSDLLAFDQAAIDNDDITPKAIAEDDILISDDLPLEDDELDEEKKAGAYGDDLEESFLDLDTWKPKETSLFDRDSKVKKSKFDQESDGSQDESWAIDLLSRDEDEEQTPKDSSFTIISPEERQTPSRQEQEESFFADEKEFGKNDFIDDEYSPSSTGSFEALDDDFEGFSEDNLGESFSGDAQEASNSSTPSKKDQRSEQYSGFDLEAHNAAEKAKSKNNSSNKSSSQNNDDSDEEYVENFSDSFEPREGFGDSDDNDDYNNDNHEEFGSDYDNSDYDSDYDNGYSDQPDRKSILKGITPAPVEFHYKGSSSNWIRRSLWAVIIIAGISGIIGQIAWNEFDTLSRKQPYRDMYISACPIIGCKVPPIAVPGMIKTTNFLVREHPTEKDALMVDTILLNTATFEQPFPNLVLTFTDIKGKTVASRSFSPKEYLGGELAGATNIPSNQPVHLALEIVNPGPEAINYSAHIPQ